jgi:hypothetical protein
MQDRATYLHIELSSMGQTTNNFGELVEMALSPLKDIRVLGNLASKVAVVADDENAVAPMDQLSAQFLVPGALSGLVVDKAIAEDVEVRGVEEIRDAVELGDGFLRFVGEPVVAGTKASRKSRSS